MPLVSKSFSDIITFTRASSGTYFDATGTLQTATTNNARFDYNPSTLAARGMLVEEQRTNSIRNNTMVGAVAGTPGTLPTNWTSSASGTGSLSVAGVGTENGIAYVDLRYQGASGDTAQVVFESTTQIVAANGQTWTSSVYVRVAAGANTNATTNHRLAYRTVAGSIVNFQDSAFAAASSFQRISNVFAASGATIERVTNQIQFVSSGAADITLRIGLPQLEQGAFATSVISTTTAAATRSADVASVNTLSPWYNASNGTFLFIGESFASDVEIPMYTAQDSGVTNFFRASWIASTPSLDRMLVYTSGASVADMQSGTITANQVFKTASAYGTNDFAKSLNGGSVATDTLGVVPTGLNQLIIGGGGFLSNRLNGRVQRITYYPRRLSNAELQGITT